MRKIFALLFLTLCLAAGFAQNDPYSYRLQKGYDLYGQNNYAAALNEFKSIILDNPEHSDAHMGAGLCLVDMYNYVEGRQYLEKAYYLEPFNNTTLRCLAYLEILEKKDLEKAKEWMTKAMMTFVSVNDIQYVDGDCSDYGKKKYPDLFNALRKFSYERYNQDYMGLNIRNLITVLEDGQRNLQAGQIKNTKQKFDQMLSILKASTQPDKLYVFRVYHLFAQLMLTLNGNEEAGIYLKDGYNYYFSNNVNQPYQLTLLAKNLSRHYTSFGETSKALAVLNKVTPISLQQPYSSQTADLYLASANARFSLFNEENDKSQKELIIGDCEKLLLVAENTGRDKSYFQAHANNTLCSVYLTSSSTSERQKALNYGESALRIAQQNKMDDLIETIQSNLSILYFQRAEYSKAMTLSKQIADNQKKNKRYTEAALTLNNLGSMLYFGEKYADAASVFKEAVDLVESYRNTVPSANKVSFLHQQISAYQFLNMSYAKLGKTTELFESFEKSRSRQLAEQISLGNNLSPASLDWVQKNLGPDEAVLMYAMGEPGSVAILAITQTQVKSINKEVPDFHEKLKQQFKEDYGFTMKLRDQESVLVDPFELQKKDDIGKVISVLRTMIRNNTGFVQVYEKINNDMLVAFYELLIQPAEALIQGKKKLIISPDSYLSFIPFDALMNKQGKYLTENYTIQYTPSMEIWKSIKARNYPDNRKNMVAFGGATYEPYFTSEYPLNTIEDFYQLQYKVSENARNNYSQRRAYATIGVTGKSWAYLPGTLQEVIGISAQVNDVKIYTEKDFTENFIRSLSASGELAKYRVLHLATHGMAVPSIPELSAIITSLPLMETGGQDGYLTVEEVKNLKLQTDFVALSACETGLGKIYSGEGVIGLTQSFLQAGSNAVSVSLWAISDDATMKFMIGFYDLVFNKKMNYPDAMAEMKRKFIKGEFGDQYKYPKFWAPFAYYGN